MFRSIIRQTCVAACVAAAMPAAASTLTTTVNAYDINGQPVAPGAATYTSSVGVTAGPTLTAKLFTAGAPAGGNGTFAQMNSELTYGFSLRALGLSDLQFVPSVGFVGTSIQQGQAASFSVPLLLTYAGSTATQGDAYVTAVLAVYNSIGQIGRGQGFCDNGYGCGTFGAVKQRIDFTYLTYNGGPLGDPDSYRYDTSGTFLLAAYMGSETLYHSGDAFARAVVDPIIEFDPTYLAAHPDALVSVDPVAMTGGIPEPASWAMMVFGFGIAGAAVRGRRAARGRLRVA